MSRSKELITVLIVVAFSISGCSLYKPENPGPAHVPKSFIETSGRMGEQALTGRWWEHFGDEKLNSLIESGLTMSPDVTQAYARLAQVQAAFHITDSVRSPFLNLEGQASRDKQFFSFNESLGNTLRLSLSAGFELDLWKKLSSLSEAARLEVLASREAVKSVYITLSTSIADLYYLTVEQRAQLKQLEKIVASYADTLVRVERRYQEGIAPSLEVYQARQNLAIARARRPVFAANLARAEHTLAVLIGRFPENNIAGDLATLPTLPEAYSAGLPSELLTQRPDIEAAYLRVQAQDARIASSIADRFPSFNLIGSYGRNNLDFGASTTGTFWSFLINSAVPVIDGGRRKAEVDRNRAMLQEDIAVYRQTVLRAFQEVEDALSNNRTSEETIVTLSDQLEVSSANVRAAEDGYFLGLNDLLTVQIAQRQLDEVKIRLLSAQRQLISDRISMIRTLGGNWMEEFIGQYLKELSH